MACHVVEHLEGIGASGVIIEDQKRPRRCGHADGKQVLPLVEYLEKLKLVLATREDLVVVARTDATEEADILRRAEALAATDADVILVDGVRSVEWIRKIRAVIGGKPLLFNQIAGGKSPRFSLSELTDLGVDVAIYSTPCLFAAQSAMDTALAELKYADGRLPATGDSGGGRRQGGHRAAGAQHQPAPPRTGPVLASPSGGRPPDARPAAGGKSGAGPAVPRFPLHGEPPDPDPVPAPRSPLHAEPPDPATDPPPAAAGPRTTPPRSAAAAAPAGPRANRPAAGEIGSRRPDGRAGGGEDVAEALRHAGELGGVPGVRRTLHDEQQREADRRALAQAQQHHPQISAGGRCEKHPRETGRAQQRPDGGQDTGPQPAADEHRREERTRDAQQRGEGEHPAGVARTHTGVREHRRQPGGDRRSNSATASPYSR